MIKSILKKTFQKPLLAAMVLSLVYASLAVGLAYALTLFNADGTWSNASGDNGAPYCVWYNNTPSTTDENQVRYGNPSGPPTCNDHDYQSGFGFDGTSGIPVTPGTTFLLGQFVHYNNPIRVNDNKTFKQVDLDIALDFDDPDINTTLQYLVNLHETNNDGSCEYPGSTSCPDKVWFDNTVNSQTFGPIDGKYYTLQIVGFQPRTGNSCPEQFDPNVPVVNEFITEESANNYACLYAKIVQAGLTIVKDADPDHYRDFHFQITGPESFDEQFDLDDDENCAANNPAIFCDANGNVLSDTKVFDGLPAGTYTVTESFDQQYDWLTSPPTCEKNGEPWQGFSWTLGPNGKGGTLVAELGESDNIVCTFNNISGNPTAVSLQNLTAKPARSSAVWLVAGVAFIGLAGAGLALRRRRSAQ
jgi:hypothetical protein